VGQDVYGDNGTARALFAQPGSTCGVAGVVCKPGLGDFSTDYTNVLNGATIPANLVPRNYLTMAGLVSVNMRIYRVFGFGSRRNAADAAAAASSGGGGFGGPGGGFGGGGRGGRGGGGGMRMGAGGGRGGGMSGGSSDRRFTLTVGANFTNVLNHLNPGGYQGVITSNQFGEATSVNTGYGGAGGGGGTANNRRIDLSLRLNF
jgi:hypothetical protein